MQEYNDGSFGPIRNDSELLKELADNPEEMGKTRAVHFGSGAELLKMKQERESEKLSPGNAKRIMSKLEQLERKINRIMIATGCADPGEILVVDPSSK